MELLSIAEGWKRMNCMREKDKEGERKKEGERERA